MALWAVIVSGVLGAIGGSFAVTAAMRTLEGRQSIIGRSACDHCQQTLGFAATIPIASYLMLGGRCRRCNSAISPVHLAGEGLGLAAGLAVAILLPPFSAVLALLLALTLLATSVVDWKTQRLPDRLTLAIAALAGGLGFLHGTIVPGLVAAGVVSLVLLGLRRFFNWRRGEPSLGLGDVKLLAALALWLGTATPWAVALAALMGLVALRLVRPVDGRIAFGPAIAAAAFMVGLASRQAVFTLPQGGLL